MLFDIDRVDILPDNLSCSPCFGVILLVIRGLFIWLITRVFAANAFLFSNEAVPERVFVKKISSRS